MKHITSSNFENVTPEIGARIEALGGKYWTHVEAYKLPEYWAGKSGWYAPEENHSAISALLTAKNPHPAKLARIVRAEKIGYDPTSTPGDNVIYFAITYVDPAAGEEKTTTLANLELAARGIGFGRGMDVRPEAVAFYHAAYEFALASRR